MGTILSTAEDFAFGPAAKLLTVTAELAGRGHDVTFAGTGTALQLARGEVFHDVLPSTGEADLRSAVDDALRSTDLLVSCMDAMSVERARRAGVPTVWLDPLSWWWDDLPSSVLEVDLYLAQRTVRAQRRNDALAARVSNLVQVGPIVPRPPVGVPRENQLLVNFGGAEATGWYRVGEDSRYPLTIMKMLARHVDLSAFDRVVVAGNARVLAMLEAEHGDRWSFQELAHSRFVLELARSCVLLTVPGLETPLEAWTLRTPTIFLPPSNSSQYVQLDEYRTHGVAAASVHFRDLMPTMELAALPLRAMMKAFLVQLRRFDTDHDLAACTGRRIDRMLGDRSSWPALVEAGERYVTDLGAGGLDTAVGLIEGLLPAGAA